MDKNMVGYISSGIMSLDMCERAEELKIAHEMQLPIFPKVYAAVVKATASELACNGGYKLVLRAVEKIFPCFVHDVQNMIEDILVAGRLAELPTKDMLYVFVHLYKTDVQKAERVFPLLVKLHTQD